MPSPDQDGLLDLIIEALRRMAQSVDKSKILGIGISSPGPLDCEGGKILNPPQFDRWHGVEISAILSQALGLPAYLEHDVCALALHQLEMGHSRNFMLVFVDIGIGAAIMSGGELVGNSRYFTGEVGHTTIRFDGRQCACGNRGCLETYASIPALLEGSSFSSWRELADSAEQSPEAQRLVYQEALYLSAGLINLLNLIPVDTIYLSGMSATATNCLPRICGRKFPPRHFSAARTVSESIRPVRTRMSARSLPPTWSSTSFSAYNHRRSTIKRTAAILLFISSVYLLEKAYTVT